ncbi:hypothetical protein B0H21DRAFT_773951 [Amylocystis lapponica]|nr:hypothetical protein B0H21DRAFT_773951 [Amylocystis lapponica]
MTSTSTTESRLRDRRSNVVPLLLSSFPAPPSHLPVPPLPQPIPSPTNPPLSLPPASPLPQSPRDTLMFISATRSRRASKLSVRSTSTYSYRDSTATIATIGSNASGSNSSAPSLSPSVSVTPLDSSTSNRSLRSSPSNGSLSVPIMFRHPDKSPKIAPRIREEDSADLTRMTLDEIPRHSHMPEPDLGVSDDEKVLDFATTLSYRRHRSTGNDSISSIDMQDLPPLQEDELGATPLSAPAAFVPRSSLRTQRRRSQTESLNKDKDLPPIPPASAPPAPRPGAESPDICTILASTPRPRRKSAGAGTSRSRSRSRVAVRRQVSEGLAPRRTSARSFRSSGTASVRVDSPSELAYAQDAMAAVEPWNEDSFIEDYGKPLDKTGTPLEIFDREEEERLDRELEGEGSDSDSSLDIHTPLPNLMLRDGLLSPNSKLLPPGSRTISPQPSLMSDRPGSFMSVASTVGTIMTKSGIYKDQRDTEKRRTRHRDGKLLKGGIGLTTGLGWSDSEDEGAPSPLTRKLSSHTLSRKSLPSSLRSSHPLTRASSDTAADSSWMGDPYASKSVVKGRTSLPSASSPRRLPASSEHRMSSASNTSSLGVQSRASVSSLHSSSSLRSTSSSRFVNAQLSHINEREESGVDSPSSASSTSLQMPPTPIGLDDVTMRSSPASFAPSIRKLHPDLQARHLRELDQSRASRSHMSTSPPSAMRRVVPRPLRLPQDSAYRPSVSVSSSNRSSSGSSTGGDSRIRTPSSGLQRAPTRALHAPALGMAQSDSTLHVASPMSSPLHSPLPSPVPGTPPTRPSMTPPAIKRPRTGTGMTYRSSSNQNLRPSLMRMPSSKSLKISATVEIPVPCKPPT